MYLLLSLLYIIGVKVAVGEVPFIATCCPSGQVLVRLKFNDFKCQNWTNSTIVPADSYIYNNTLPVHGYRIQVPQTIPNKPLNRVNNIPLCNEIRFLAFSSFKDVETTPRSCLVQLMDKIIALSCPLSNDEYPSWLSFVHKCCPIDHVYDYSQRKCVLGAPNYAHYTGLLTNPAVFIDQMLNCPKDKALVDYRLTAGEFSLNDGQLIFKDALRKRFNFDSYCVEAVHDSSAINQSSVASGILKSLHATEFIVRTCDELKVCQQLPCIRRCCADGEMFTKGNATSYCKKDETDMTFHSSDSLEISANFTKPAVFGILRSLDCLKYRLDPDSYADESHTINEHDGSLLVHATHILYTNEEYCVDKIRNSTWGNQKLFTFLCFDSKVVGKDKIRFKMYPIGLLISCSFYAMTLLVYLSISRLRNLPGKILICLVCSLFAAYLGIALGQLMPAPNDTVCFVSGFFVYFCLIAAFAWMNVTCFDIWQTFGSASKKHGIKKSQTSRFLCYSLYGWGLPTLFTIITVSLTKSDVLADYLRPQFGHGRCWFTYDTLASANLLFFSGPVGVLFLINFVLFSLTLRYCNKVKREIFRMQSSNMEKPALRRRFFMDKARFVMNTKLFIVMGITWLLELLSILFYDHKKTFFWAISDSFNVLLGVFVFFIFVFKKRVWYSILEKLGLRTKSTSKNTPNATCATHSTCAHSISMTRLNAIDGNTSLIHANSRFSPK